MADEQSSSDSSTTSDADALTALLAAHPDLAHCSAALSHASLSLAECFAILASGGRPQLLEKLKACGVQNIRERQAVAKVIAVASRDPVEYRNARAELPSLEAIRCLPARMVPAVSPGPLSNNQSRAQEGYFQDVRCLQYHDWKVGGFYLEIGVADALKANNTVLLDETFGWAGICVDPNAPNVSQRSCVHFNVALASKSGTASFSHSGPFSGLTEFVSSPVHNAMWCDMADRMWTSEVRTCTPREVLEAAAAPAHIDYLSLDVEGSEMDILCAFPFEDYTIAFATVETNNDEAKEREMRHFMKSKGYAFLGHAGNDDYYAVEPARHDARLSPPLDYTDPTRTAATGRSGELSKPMKVGRDASVSTGMGG